MEKADIKTKNQELSGNLNNDFLQQALICLWVKLVFGIQVVQCVSVHVRVCV